MTLPAPPFGRETIESIIPHRPPFLLVDEVLEIEPGRRVRGRYLVPADAWWFHGHFPERPVMPGVLTVEAIARTVPLLPKEPTGWIVAGGGARNLKMLRMLRERLAPVSVEAADTLGWSADAIEAQAFGFLAARGLKGLPLSYPATTGVPIPMTGGVVARP